MQSISISFNSLKGVTHPWRTWMRRTSWWGIGQGWRPRLMGASPTRRRSASSWRTRRRRTRWRSFLSWRARGRRRGRRARMAVTGAWIRSSWISWLSSTKRTGESRAHRFDKLCILSILFSIKRLFYLSKSVKILSFFMVLIGFLSKRLGS